MGYELPKKIQKLQYYGNTIVSFLEIALHHLNRNYGMTKEQALHCFSFLNLTADGLGICKLYDAIDCNERNLMYVFCM